MKRLIFLVVLVASVQAIAQNLISQSQSDIIFKSAKDLLAHHEYGAARDAFAQFLVVAPQNDPRRTDAEYYEAFSGLSLYHGDGEKKISDFIESHPQSPKSALAYYDLGSFFYGEKNYQKASAYFQKVDFPSLGNETQNTGRFRWGYSLFNLRKLKESLDQFNFIKSQGGQFGIAASYYAGVIEYGNGDYAAALVDLKRAEANESYATIVPYIIANVYYKQKKYDELLTYTNSLATRENISDSKEIALLSAEAYFKKGDYKNALTGFNNYLEGKESADKGVLYRAGFAAYSMQMDDVAINYLRRSASDQDSVGFYSSYYLGSLYLKKQQKPLALNAFDNARKFKSDPRIVEESSFQFAKISYELGKPDQAIAEFENFVVRFPSSVHITEVKELLSQTYVNANNFNKAIEYIESLPKRGPNIDMAYQKATLLKGEELFNKEEYENAVKFFEKSLQYPIDQNLTAEASFWAGETYSIGRKYSEAATHYQRIIGLADYKNLDILSKTRYGLGYAFFNQQIYDRSLFNFKEYTNKAVRTDPNLPDGVLRLADSYYVTKNYNDALINYRKAIQLNASDKDYAYLQAGIILSIQRKYPESMTELDVVIRNYPQSRFIDEAMFQRAQLDFEQGNYGAAASGFSRLMDTQKASKFIPYALTRRASSYYNLKDYNKTAADYISVIENFPAHPVTNDVLIPLQEALTLAGRPTEFDKYLATFKTANPGAKGIESVEFESAKTLYFNQEYQRAITNLNNYVISYPESPRVEEAKYYQAESYYRLKENGKALAIYNELAKDHTFSLVSKVIARVAELEFKAGNFEKAIPSFRELSKMASTKKEQFTAWSGLMESHFLLAAYDSSDYYAKLIMEKGNVNAGAQNKASLFIGKAAKAKGDYETAKDEFITTLNTAQDEYGAEAKYLLAEIFYLNKDYKQSNETLISLNRDFSSYTDWVGKSYLLLADNYLAMGDAFQTKATLKSLIDNFPQEQVKTVARERLKKLEDEELKKTVKPDSIEIK